VNLIKANEMHALNACEIIIEIGTKRERTIELVASDITERRLVQKPAINKHYFRLKSIPMKEGAIKGKGGRITMVE
jgi:hypothetical protein